MRARLNGSTRLRKGFACSLRLHSPAGAPASECGKEKESFMVFDLTTIPRPAVALFALLLAVAARRVWRRRNTVLLQHRRGRTLRSVEQVKEALADTVKEYGIRLGLHLLPHRVAYGHFAVVGATGSGKTLLQRLLMQSVLPRIGTGLEQRALIYDAKQDILSLLAGMDLRCPVTTFHPFDTRGVAWDMAGDITSPAAALQAATLLVPKAQHDANPFFSNAARHLMYAALLALMVKASNRWTLRHLLLVLRSESLLRLVLAQTEFTRPLLQYGEHPTTFQNILSTLLTRTAPYEIIAAAWDHAERKLSLRAWLDQESILILANDEDHRAALDTLNQLLFKRLSELVLARDERTEDSLRTTWFFLDEVRQAGKLDGLSAHLISALDRAGAAGLETARPLKMPYDHHAPLFPVRLVPPVRGQTVLCDRDRWSCLRPVLPNNPADLLRPGREGDFHPANPFPAGGMALSDLPARFPPPGRRLSILPAPSRSGRWPFQTCQPIPVRTECLFPTGKHQCRRPGTLFPTGKCLPARPGCHFPTGKCHLCLPECHLQTGKWPPARPGGRKQLTFNDNSLTKPKPITFNPNRCLKKSHPSHRPNRKS